MLLSALSGDPAGYAPARLPVAKVEALDYILLTLVVNLLNYSEETKKNSTKTGNHGIIPAPHFRQQV